MVGNTGIIKALKSLYQKPREEYGQVLLFHGSSGVGKTTLARILATYYVCEHPQQDGTPCGECGMCLAMQDFIALGKSENLLHKVREIDAGRDRGVEAVDDFLEDATRPNFEGGWKVFILDECHVFSETARKRLLKFLEEPPERVAVLLCTTDPQRLKDTILTRCQGIFHVEKPKLTELIGLLRTTCKAEKWSYEVSALRIIAKQAEGIPRMAYQLLQEVQNVCKDIHYDKVVEYLGVVQDSLYHEFLNLVLRPQINTVLYIRYIAKIDQDILLYTKGLIHYLSAYIYIMVGAGDLTQLDPFDIKRCQELQNTGVEAATVSILLKWLTGLSGGEGKIKAEYLRLGFEGLEGLRAPEP